MPLAVRSGDRYPRSETRCFKLAMDFDMECALIIEGSDRAESMNIENATTADGVRLEAWNSINILDSVDQCTFR